MKALALVLALFASAQEPAQPPASPSAAPAPAPNDYADGKNWLCRPGREDACAVDLATTVVAADGKLTREAWKADPNAPIDCFYVYPTVSTDPTPNSDMTADPAETNVIRQQFARFASVCRPYAPLYRQVTLAGLRRMMAGGGAGGSLASGVGYDDVRDAWNSYLKTDNKGRGVVLIGHSQGSYVLTELIRREIDGKPVQARMVSALLLGATVTVAKGKDVGGSFQAIPVCRQASQTGCLIAFSSFRSTLPPPANTLFGKVADPALTAVCANPAALGGGSAPLRAYLSATGRTITGTIAPKPWVTPEQPIETPFVSAPGLLSAKCATNENATYLEVTVHGDPADPRVDDITGDIGREGAALANWGLHLIDVGLTMGDLLDVVQQQSKAFAAKKK
jgi:hypothetical protein